MKTVFTAVLATLFAGSVLAATPVTTSSPTVPSYEVAKKKTAGKPGKPGKAKKLKRAAR